MIDGAADTNAVGGDVVDLNVGIGVNVGDGVTGGDRFLGGGVGVGNSVGIAVRMFEGVLVGYFDLGDTVGLSERKRVGKKVSGDSVSGVGSAVGSSVTGSNVGRLLR
jgi:hypothetical protein